MQQQHNAPARQLHKELRNGHTEQLGDTLELDDTLGPESHTAQLWWNECALPQEKEQARKHYDKQALAFRLELELSPHMESERAHLGIALARLDMVVEPELGEELAPVAPPELELVE